MNAGQIWIGKRDFELLIGAIAKAGRYSLDGVLVERRAGVLRLVASDTHRLAVVAVENQSGEDESAIISLAALKARITEKATKRKPRYRIDLDGISERERLEGNFPRYAEILPKQGDAGIVAFRITSEQNVQIPNGSIFGLKYLADIGKRAVTEMVFHHFGQGKAQETPAAYEDDTLTYVLMPVRDKL